MKKASFTGYHHLMMRQGLQALHHEVEGVYRYTHSPWIQCYARVVPGGSCGVSVLSLLASGVVGSAFRQAGWEFRVF